MKYFQLHMPGDKAFDIAGYLQQLRFGLFSCDM